MKIIREHLQNTCYGLMFLVLFQSCVVYHKTPVTMEQAAADKIKTKIVLKDKSIEKFKYITYEDQHYFGTRVTGKGHVKIPIDVNDVSEVKIKDKTASIVVTVIPLAILTALVIAGSNYTFGLDGY